MDAYLRAVTEELVRALGPHRIILFGSFARGDQNRASDLDLVVVAETNEPFCDRIGRVLDVCYRASTRLPVEALVYTPQEWTRMVRSRNSFVQQVMREGRVLYERKPQSERGAALAGTGTA